MYNINITSIKNLPFLHTHKKNQILCEPFFRNHVEKIEKIEMQVKNSVSPTQADIFCLWRTSTKNLFCAVNSGIKNE